jgi:hypothetical protein
MRFRLSILVLFVASALRLDAGCGSSSCPIDLHALNRPRAGSFAFDLSFQYIDQDQPRILTRRAQFGEIASEHEELRTINRAATLTMMYGATESLQLGLAVPYVSRAHEHIMSETGELERWNLHGIGDVMLHARYRFGGELWAMGGVKLPTGASGLKNGAERVEVAMQPGSGATDILAGLAWERVLIRSAGTSSTLGSFAAIPLFAGVTYRRNGTAHHYTIGDEWQLNAGTAYPLRSNVEVLLQANARAHGRDQSPNADDREMSGGRALFLSPGVRFSAGPAAWYALLQLPVYQRVNGLQLTSQRNVISGIQMRF